MKARETARKRAYGKHYSLFPKPYLLLKPISPPPRAPPILLPPLIAPAPFYKLLVATWSCYSYHDREKVAFSILVLVRSHSLSVIVTIKHRQIKVASKKPTSSAGWARSSNYIVFIFTRLTIPQTVKISPDPHHIVYQCWNIGFQLYIVGPELYLFSPELKLRHSYTIPLQFEIKTIKICNFGPYMSVSRH